MLEFGPDSTGTGRVAMSGRPRSYWRDCLVVSLAVGVIGVTFGVFADAAGFDLAQIVVMSAFVFTGASQFAAVGVIDDGGSGGAAVGSALLLAARNALYGPVARRALPASALARLASAHFVIDETTAMAAAQDDSRDARGASGSRPPRCGCAGTWVRSRGRCSEPCWASPRPGDSMLPSRRCLWHCWRLMCALPQGGLPPGSRPQWP